jgi:DNA-binding NarL/FixJ family response regulator
MNVKVVVADNHPVVIEGVRQALRDLQSFEVQCHAYGLTDALLAAELSQLSAQLLITDLKSPDSEGFSFIRNLHKSDPRLKILVFSRFEHSALPALAKKAGASGYLNKSQSFSDLQTAIEATLLTGSFFPGLEPSSAQADQLAPGAAENQLTRREAQILQLISKAMSNKQIAGELFISDQTVSVHRKNIMRKLGVCNTAGLVKAAYEYCLV